MVEKKAQDIYEFVYVMPSVIFDNKVVFNIVRRKERVTHDDDVLVLVALNNLISGSALQSTMGELQIVFNLLLHSTD